MPNFQFDYRREKHLFIGLRRKWGLFHVLFIWYFWLFNLLIVAFRCWGGYQFVWSFIWAVKKVILSGPVGSGCKSTCSLWSSRQVLSTSPQWTRLTAQIESEKHYSDRILLVSKNVDVYTLKIDSIYTVQNYAVYTCTEQSVLYLHRAMTFVPAQNTPRELWTVLSQFKPVVLLCRGELCFPRWSIAFCYIWEYEISA